MKLGGILPVAWLLIAWGTLLTAHEAGVMLPMLVILVAGCQVDMVRRYWLLWLTAGMLLLVAVVLAYLFVPGDIQPQNYLNLLAVVVAPTAVLRYVDPFWLCGWLIRIGCPQGMVLAVSAAGAAFPLIINDIQSLVYLESRVGKQVVGSPVGLLVAAISGLFNHLVALEIAYEMFDVIAIYRRWEGRPIVVTEWLFLPLAAILLWLAMS